ncbi:3625_t:CDS:1, partial [Scutellospora calospora]
GAANNKTGRLHVILSIEACEVHFRHVDIYPNDPLSRPTHDL